MNDHIELIHHRWLQDNYRPGALGIIIRDYLQEHSTTLAQYENFIEHWTIAMGSHVFVGNVAPPDVDWYFPSLVENLQDWSYQEDIFYRNMIKSRHPNKWLSILPHALSRMPLFNLAAAFRWEPYAKKWPEEILRVFYDQLDSTVSKTFVASELNRPRLSDMNLLRLIACLNPEHYNAQEKAKGKPWNAIWTLLQHNDWTHQHNRYFKDMCDKWIRYAPMQSLSMYIDQANTLLRHSEVQWHRPFLDNFICRVRNVEESGATLIDAWAQLYIEQNNKEKKIPWDYILNNWSNWASAPLLDLVMDQTMWQQALQELILANPDYAPIVKRDILMYRCEQGLIGPRDIEISKQLPQELLLILMFWIVYSKPLLKKESVKIFQSLYKLHPIYEHDAVVAHYLPGLSGISIALQTMSLPWRQALSYAEEAMRSKADVHELLIKEIQLDVTDGLFESQT